MTDGVRTVLHHNEIEALRRDPDLRAGLLQVSWPIAVDAARRAPKLSGAGAANIRPEAVLDGDEITAHISWDRDHFYMSFHETGTTSLPARPFLVPALEAAA